MAAAAGAEAAAEAAAVGAATAVVEVVASSPAPSLPDADWAAFRAADVEAEAEATVSMEAVVSLRLRIISIKKPQMWIQAMFV